MSERSTSGSMTRTLTGFGMVAVSIFALLSHFGKAETLGERLRVVLSA
jgi:predicted exporter